MTGSIIGVAAARDEVIAADEAHDGARVRKALDVLHREEAREDNDSGKESAPRSRRGQIASMAYSEVCEDRFLLDRIVRALALAKDLDWIDALEHIQALRARRGGDPSLEQVLKDAVDLDGICRDVVVMEDREAPPPTPEVQLLDSSDPERKASIEATDELGRVLLPDGVDRAHLLTDAYAIERAWLKVQELDERGAYRRGVTHGDGLDGRERFEQAYREHIEAGADLVASLEAENWRACEMAREDEAIAKGHAAADREAIERADRATKRELEAQRDEIDAKLRGT